MSNEETNEGPNAATRALKTTGRVLADANLRQLGRGTKRLASAVGSKLPSVRIERKPAPQS